MMNKANDITEIGQASQTGLGKTFLIGMATPIVSVMCTFARKERPSWLTREFMYSTRPLKNAAFALGLVTGASALTGSICVAGAFVVDTYLAPTNQTVKHTEHQSSLRNLINREIA